MILFLFAIKFSSNFIIKKRINFDILSIINSHKIIFYIFVFKCSLHYLHGKFHFDFPSEYIKNIRDFSFLLHMLFDRRNSHSLMSRVLKLHSTAEQISLGYLMF